MDRSSEQQQIGRNSGETFAKVGCRAVLDHLHSCFVTVRLLTVICNHIIIVLKVLVDDVVQVLYNP